MDTLVFLDFDGVLNSEQFFNRRYREDENGTYRDYQESLLPFLDTEWFTKLNDERNQTLVKSFYKNICYTNYRNLLKLLSKIENPKVVLSTSWRHGFSLESWNILFNKLPNWKYNIVGLTPTNPKSGKRYEEVKASINFRDLVIGSIDTHEDWSRHKEILTYVSYYDNRTKRFNPYIILDDDDIFLEPWQSSDRFFRTNRNNGLTNKDIRKILKYLKGVSKCKQ